MDYLDYEKEHLATVRQLLPECAVLLKSDGAFPLDAPGPLALYGSGARNTVKGGTGSGEVNSRFSETIEQGLQAAGFTVTTTTWLDRYDACRAQAKKAFKKVIQARAKAMHTQTIIAGMGMTMPEPEYDLPTGAPGEVAVYVLARSSGEGQDRQPVKGDLLLTDTEVRDILDCARRYPKFMLVLNVGGPVDLSPVVQEVPNILVLSQLGVLCGTALADLLLGRQSPSGKLSTTWAAWADRPPMLDFGDADDTHYREGIYVGYRYYEAAGVQPLFPFGFGLSYTNFAVQFADAALDGAQVTVTARVTNTGSRPGKEVAQLYVSKPWGALDQPRQELAAFAKTNTLQPGETQTLALRFPLPELASFSAERSAYLLEPGDYTLRLGADSASAVPCAIIELPEEVIVRPVHAALGHPELAEYRPDKPEAQPRPADLPVLTVDPAQIPREAVRYDIEQPVPDEVKRLTDEELAKICLGAFDPKGGMGSIIGNAGQTVPGAAGQTAAVEGFPTLVMADGPAGLRLSRDYYVDATGAHGLAQGLPESMQELMSPALVFLMNLGRKKPPKDAEILHQYATMIPIGTAIAQSWNVALAAACGDIVGAEMERFGVHYWLAPALNIHRSPLCGRNFEYFSEDPYLSGKMAAAITRGMQAHPGCGVTLKHYAANNQENNRYANNSIVSERAMREVYLKGFELSIREAQPEAVMTSYNLLNGVHTAERRDLTCDILRAEFGFEGVIMTDWMAGLSMMARGKHPVCKAENVLAAGGTLVMPGSKKDYEAVLAALRAGTLPRHTLEQAAALFLTHSRTLTAARN